MPKLRKDRPFLDMLAKLLIIWIFMGITLVVWVNLFSNNHENNVRKSYAGDRRSYVDFSKHCYMRNHVCKRNRLYIDPQKMAAAINVYRRSNPDGHAGSSSQR